MDRKKLAVVFAIVAAAVGAIIVLLATGEAEPVRTFEDLSGDQAVSEGDNPPVDTTLADIRAAEVTSDGGEVVFETRLAMTVPEKLQGSSFGLRWEVYEGGDSTFLITANLDVGPNASIVGQQTNYGASTIDESLPGSLELADDTITIRVEADQIPDFPDEFAWVLTTSLDGDQGDPTSARAEDRAPDQGFGEFPTD